ncbi:MAG: SCO family protein [Bacteroidota bacterium]
MSVSLSKFSLFVLSFLLFVSCTEDKKVRVLPIVGNYDVEYSTVDGKEVTDTIYPKIPAFSYLNQDSVMITSKSMKGKVWIADFFFTSCPTICPKMTSQMKRLSFLTKDLEQYVQFMSFSINPDNDKPSVLRRYIKLHGITAKNWHFFTGDEEKTHALGINYFNVFANKDIESEGGYAHSPAFVLIDTEGYVRGVYVGTDTKQVDLLHKDLRKLLKYEYEYEISE